MKKLFFIIALFLFSGFLISNSTQNIELKFSHQFHVVEQELECATCHESTASSVSGKDNLLPTMETCADCHDVESDDNCNLCHSDLDEPRAVPRVEDYSPLFNHQAHLNKGFECENCHASVNQKTKAEPYDLPNMVFCMDCHKENLAANECSTCHLPEESLVPANHVLDFKHQHSDLALNQNSTILNDKQCSTCHQTSFCQECHEGDNLGLLSHPMNYQFTHALEAQGKEMECSVCHTERSFCIDCHRDNQVMPHNHTAGWTNTIDGGRHKMEAEFDLESCMACHEQNAEQVCQPCHGN